MPKDLYLNEKNSGEIINLNGWIVKHRLLSDLIFCDLEIYYHDVLQVIQVVFDRTNPHFDLAKGLKVSDVVNINGTIVERKKPNSTLPTGKIELIPDELIIINRSKTTPLIIADITDALEPLRMKYRYLDLRRPQIKELILFRSRFNHLLRCYFIDHNFVEIETPVISKPTFGGAAELVFSSKNNPKLFYSLVQSPQIYKQLLMYAGFNKYFQIAKCFRDEDLRSDRQLEFSQLDLELSFTNEKSIRTLIEKLLKKVFSELLDKKLTIPFPVLSYDEAIKYYGSDKPDLRKPIKEYEIEAKAKFGDYTNFTFAFLWVNDWPLFELNNESELTSAHNPFTAPNEADISTLLKTDCDDQKTLLKFKSQSYDLVLNGNEIGGGSIRITNFELQRKIFEILGLNSKQIDTEFGWFLEAQQYGIPKHGGIALGLDRILALIQKQLSIREVIAFPKSTSGRDEMMGAPIKLK